MTITTKFFHPDDSIDVVSGPAPQIPPAPVSGAATATLPTITDNGSRTVVPAPSVAGNAPALCGPRAELETITRQIERASEDLAVARQPIANLERAIADADLAARDLESAQSGERDILSTWLACDRQGPRPQPSKALLEAERRVAETARDAAAARSALPNHQSAAQRAAEHRNTLVQRRSEAHKAVVLEAVSEFIAGPFTDALRLFRGVEGRIAAIEAHFQQTGDIVSAQAVRALATNACGLVPDMGGDGRSGSVLVAMLLRDPAASL